MRSVSISIGGTPTKGDVVVVWYTVKRGGKTAYGHIVREGDTLEEIATQIAAGINTYWCPGAFSAKAKGTIVSVLLNDFVDDATLFQYVEHIVDGDPLKREPGGTETVTISEE
jgi:hypothetical protein